MESSGVPPAQPPPPQQSPQPPAQPPPPPPGAVSPPPASEKAGGGMRALAVILALVLALAALIMILAMVDISKTPTCADVAANRAQPFENSCFDGGQTQKTISLVLGFAGGGVGAIAAVLALAFAISGTDGRRLLWATALAIILSGLSILIGSV